jgi:hypothetical protein
VILGESSGLADVPNPETSGRSLLADPNHVTGHFLELALDQVDLLRLILRPGSPGLKIDDP